MIFIIQILFCVTCYISAIFRPEVARELSKCLNVEKHTLIFTNCMTNMIRFFLLSVRVQILGFQRYFIIRHNKVYLLMFFRCGLQHLIILETRSLVKEELSDGLSQVIYVHFFCFYL